jgi:hypothetical protein
MNFPYKAAVSIRLRYLAEQLVLWEMYTDFEAPYMDVPYAAQPEIIEEMISLTASIKEEKKKDDVTYEDIQQADAYPIDKLINFTRGKCTCPFHEDKQPSMFHGTKRNIAMCPVCNKGWGPIKLLIDRDGIPFSKAVKDLCSM